MYSLENSENNFLKLNNHGIIINKCISYLHLILFSAYNIKLTAGLPIYLPMSIIFNYIK